MKPLILSSRLLLLGGTIASIILVAGCGKTDEATTTPAAPSAPGSQPQPKATIPPQVQIGPPK